MAKKDKYDYDEYEERRAYLPGESNLTGKSGTLGYNATPTVQDRYGITGVNSGGINPVNEVLYYDALAAADYARNPTAKAVPTIDDKGPNTDLYAGGGGTQTTATNAAWEPQLPSFSYEAAPEFVSRYQGLIDEYLNGVLNRPAFSYNYEDDPLYQQYAKSYGDAGRRAMQDTLAQISARTGGIASSYAGSASQQAYNQYMARLADKVPELQQLAYQMWQDEDSRARSNLSLLQGMDATDYGRYQDRLGQYNTDRSFAYGVYGDERSDALQMAQLAASMGDYRGLKALGIDTSTAEAKARGGGGSGGVSKSDARSIIENHVKMGGSISDLPAELIAASGYPDAYLGAMGDYYAAGGEGDSSYTPTFKNYSDLQKAIEAGDTDNPAFQRDYQTLMGKGYEPKFDSPSNIKSDLGLPRSWSDEKLELYLAGQGDVEEYVDNGVIKFRWK